MSEVNQTVPVSVSNSNGDSTHIQTPVAPITAVAIPVAPAALAPVVLSDRPFDDKTASLIELKEVARLFASGNTFKDASSPATCFTKMLVGRDLGIPMTRALIDITMIQGKPTLSANLMAGMIKASGKYRFTKRTHTDQECSIEVFERVDGKWESLGISKFTMADAATAGLMSNPTWKKFPKNMLFSRVISNIAKQECGDVFLGSVYTPDELDSSVQLGEDGEVINAQYSRREINGQVNNTNRIPGLYPVESVFSPTEVLAMRVQSIPFNDVDRVDTHASLVQDVKDLMSATGIDEKKFLKEAKVTKLESLDAACLKNTKQNLILKLQESSSHLDVGIEAGVGVLVGSK